MRFLLEEKAVIVIEEIDAVFQNTSVNPFMYDSPHNTRILSGEEEGVFAWIAVNYLSRRLTNLDAGGFAQACRHTWNNKRKGRRVLGCESYVNDESNCIC